MASVIERWARRRTPDVEQRYTVDDYFGWVQNFYYNGLSYSGVQSTLDGSNAQVPPGFVGRVQAAYQSNGVIFACQTARQLIFEQGRIVWQDVSEDGRPGDYFISPNLDIFDRPWPNASVADLLSIMLQDADLAGNFFGRRVFTSRDGVQIERLRPDWVVIVMVRRPELASEVVIGYQYYPGGIREDVEPISLSVNEVVHWAPIRDPLEPARGMSWLTPVIREIKNDNAAMNHRLKYYENAASPNVIISYDPQFTFDQFKRMMAEIDSRYSGVDNAYRIMHLAGGADAEVVGNSMEQQDFKNILGHGETRVCAAARVPPVIVGLSEGLQAATYSNYGQARRHFADSWARPYWDSATHALGTLVRRPRPRARLRVDDRDIPFLREDRKDAAEILRIEGETVTQLIRDGFVAESAIAAVVNGDLTLLEHTGRLSVQLQDEDAQPDDADDEPADDADDEDDDEQDDAPAPSLNGTGA